jgi:hypothetical protein
LVFFQVSMADQDASDGEEGLVNVGSSLITDTQSAELVEPGQGAFNHPSMDPEATTVGGIPPRQQWPNMPSL